MATSRGIKLTEQHLRLIYDTFKLLDDDRDGLIDKGQFFTLFRALGQTTSDAQLSKVFAGAPEAGIFPYFSFQPFFCDTLSVLAVLKKNGFGAVLFAHAAAVAEQAKEGAKLAAAASSPAPPALAKKAAPPPKGETVSFQTFVKSFSDAYQKPMTETVLINACNVFDPTNSGKLSMTQLHDVVTKRGEPLSKAEVDELMLVAALSNAKQVDYALLAKRQIAEGTRGHRHNPRSLA
ncbi:hypothetical protein Emag_005347 [Eimeria magna]